MAYRSSNKIASQKNFPPASLTFPATAVMLSSPSELSAEVAAPKSLDSDYEPSERTDTSATSDSNSSADEEAPDGMLERVYSIRNGK
jgi:hypothetical protein